MRFLQTGPISSRVKVAAVIHLVFFTYLFGSIFFSKPVAVQPGYFVPAPFYWLWLFIFFPQVITLSVIAGDGYEHVSFDVLFWGLLAAFAISYLYATIIIAIFRRVLRRVSKGQQLHNAAS